MTSRWMSRPPGSNWGEFGDEDQLGRLNMVTQREVLLGAAEVREGLTFSLSLPQTIGLPNALRSGPDIRPSQRHGRAFVNYPLHLDNPVHTDVMSDDTVAMHLQFSTHIDALAHVGMHYDADGDGIAEPVFYNGYRAAEHIVGPVTYNADGENGCEGPFGAFRLGIENTARFALQGRGVMIDLCSHVGRDRVPVGYDRLMAIIEEDGVSVEAGDLVCLWSGVDTLLLDPTTCEDAELLRRSGPGLDGRDRRLLKWITDSGVAAFFSDTIAVELTNLPQGKDRYPYAPLHEHCLVKLGLHLGEMWRLNELAAWLRAKRRSRFLLTVAPLDLPGAFGSPINPIATV